METIDGIEGVRAVIWDFDGVLNVAGDRWREALATELGVDAADLARAVFDRAPRALLTGAEDVLDRIEDWARGAGFDGAAEDILEILFETDNDPDRTLLSMIAQLDRAGLVQAIATNSEPRRARFLELEGGWGDRVEAIFASGAMGVMKPDTAFFQQIEEALGLRPHELLLIDDTEAHVDAADRRGWRSWHHRPGTTMALAQALMPLMLRAAPD